MRKTIIDTGWKKFFKSSLGRARTIRVADGVKRLITVAILSCVTTMGWAEEPEADRRIDFHIPQQRADLALTEFAEQADLTLAIPRDVLLGKEANTLIGSYTLQEGIDVLLAGTGLIPEFSNRIVLSIKTDPKSVGEGKTMKSPKKATGLAALLASVFAGGVGAEELGTTDGDLEEFLEELEEIIVTGTNIKGVGNQFSPVASITRDEIDFQGLSTVEELINTLPQNFGGGGVSSDIGGGDNANGAGASAINLRGLGVEATLVLLNGRRVAAGGGLGNFVDVSAIPVSAIDRVEVVADGASAVYGSDAVAGVVNIILRSDYNGAETRINYDTVTDGGAGSFRVGQTIGFSNDRANGMVTYQYGTTNPLESTDKDFSENSPQPNDLTPFTQTNSVFASGGLKITDKMRIAGDFYYNDRKTKQFSASQLLSPTSSFTEVNSEQLGATGSLEFDLSDGWSAEFIGTYSESDLQNDTTRFDIVLTTNQPSSYTNYSVDGVVSGRLPSFSDEPSRLAFGGHSRSEDINNSRVATDATSTIVSRESIRDREVFAVFGELYTPIVTEANAIPGVKRLVLAGAVRYEDYDDVGSSTNPRVGVVWSPINDLSLRGTYGTSFRAPALFQLNNNYQAILTRYQDPDTVDMNTPALLVTGNTDNLDPEESESWSVGFDWTPAAIEGLKVGATYFDIDYDGRIGVPAIATNSDFRLDNFTVSVTASTPLG